MRLLIVLLLAAIASAKRPDKAPLKTHSAKDRIPGQYIVKLKEGQDVNGAIKKLGNANLKGKFNKAFRGFAAKLPAQLVERLRDMEEVDYIEEDAVVYASEAISWGLDRIDDLDHQGDQTFQPAWDGNGAGVNVYVLDTGMNIHHMDFDRRASVGFDAYGGDGLDCNGHGTHVAGTVAGTRYGVAKRANVISVRVLGCQGEGSDSKVLAGMEWVLTNAISGRSVAVMSFGSGRSYIIDDVIKAMYDDGITVVAAAGNEDMDACLLSPAGSPYAITVGATDRDDSRAWFSNYGSCLDIFAPGVDIRSAWYKDRSRSITISGTSMSCPHVAGAAAIVIGMNEPNMSPLDVKDFLLDWSISGAVTSRGKGSPNRLLYVGTQL